MQDVNVDNALLSPNNIACVEVIPTTNPQEALITSVKNAQRTLACLERSLHKTSKYEQRLMQCKSVHTHSHLQDSHKWWDSDPSEQKSFKCSRTSPTSSSESGVGEAKSWSTISIVCLQYKYEELSKRYNALLAAYDEQCRETCARDVRVAQWRQRAKLAHSQLAHAHRALLDVGEKYLALRKKRNAAKARYEERISRLKDTLHGVVEATAREQLRFDAKLAYCMTNERSSDAALLLYEIRKCNLLFLENLRLKSVIEELLPGHVHWKKKKCNDKSSEVGK